METAVFKAVCPLEIGDTVAIGAGKTKRTTLRNGRLQELTQCSTSATKNV